MRFTRLDQKNIDILQKAVLKEYISTTLKKAVKEENPEEIEKMNQVPDFCTVYALKV